MSRQPGKFFAIFAGLVLAAAAATLGAQNSQAPSNAPVDTSKPPAAPIVRSLANSKGVIRSAVDLVQIDVQVVDRDGKPVKGLTQNQFRVVEDGKSRKFRPSNIST